MCSYFLAFKKSKTHQQLRFPPKKKEFWKIRPKNKKYTEISQKRIQHTIFWTGHMKKIKLYQRKNMKDLLSDNNFFNDIKRIINF